MNRSLAWLLAVSSLCLLVNAPRTDAQEVTGTLRGFVTDAQEAPLVGVTIQISSPTMMGLKKTQTDVRGEYRLFELPPGIYDLVAKLQNFGDYTKSGIKVHAGETSAEDLQMKVATVVQSVTVTGSAPLIDSERSTISYNVSNTMLSTLPFASQPNYTVVWSMWPGVVGLNSTSNPVVNGGAQATASGMLQNDSYENKMFVDGMELNDSMAGQNGATLNYDSIQEVDVKTEGATAEYGNARRGFMNIVTKSGSNQFHASALFQFAPMAWNWTNIPGGVPSMSSYADPGFVVDGPILKNKLWFMISARHDDQHYQFPQTVVVPKIVRVLKDWNRYFKATAQPFTKHWISFAYQDDYRARSPETPSIVPVMYSSPESLDNVIQGGPMYILNYRWVPTATLMFDATGGFTKKPGSFYALNAVPMVNYYSAVNGNLTSSTQGAGQDYWSIRDTSLYTAKLTWFKHLGSTGSHEFKVGVELRPRQKTPFGRDYFNDSHGYFEYYYANNYAQYGLSQPYLWQAQQSVPNSFSNVLMGRNYDLFAQDSWNVTRRLTLSLGIRWEKSQEITYGRDQFPAWMTQIYSGMLNNEEFNDNGFAPRFGAAYNMGKAGVVRASYGKYFEYVGTGDYPNYASNVVFNYYRVSPQNYGQGISALQMYLPGTMTYTANYDKDLKMEYTKEFSTSYEKRLFWNVVSDVSFVATRTDPSNVEDVNAIFQNGQFVGRIFPQYDAIQMRTTYTGANRRTYYSYEGLLFDVKRNFTKHGGFVLNASKMWNAYVRLKWDPGDPQQFVYSSPGDLAQHNVGVTWILHASGFYQLPFGIGASVILTGESGVWVNDLTGAYGLFDTAPLVTLSNGRQVQDIVWLAKNSFDRGGAFGLYGRTTTPQWIPNVRFSKGVTIKEKYWAEASFDLYNVFNSCYYGGWSSADIRNSLYTTQVSPSSPRTAQLNLRFRF